MSRLDVGKGAAFLYIETIAGMFSAYLLWLIITKITTAEVIGTASAVVSMSTIFGTIVILGVPTGVQRFLGKSFSEERLEDARLLIKTSLIIVLVGVLVCSVGIYLARYWISDVFRFDEGLITVSILLVAFTAISALFRSFVISSLKTKILPIATIVSTIIKLVTTMVLILIGMGALGVTIGFTFYPIVSSVILAASIILMIFKESNYKCNISFTHAYRNILASSMPTWIPGLISIIGSQLGLIIVLASQGAEEAGVYSIAFSVFMGISAGVTVLSAIAFPALSAMTEGRKRFACRIIKMSLVITLPFASSLVFYSKDIMRLFGHGYVIGSSTLEILLLSTLPTAVMSSVAILVYAYGNYKQVLVIGLAVTIPRVVLYFVFIPIYGGIGAALSYSTGSVIVFIVCIIIARNIRLRISWKELALLFFVPLGIAFTLSNLGVNYIAGIIITHVVSYCVLLRMLVLSRSDVEDVLGILPGSIATPTISLVITIAKKLNRSF